MSKSKMIDVTVLVAEDHKDDVKKVARDLRSKGFVLREALEAIGVLTGSVPAEDVATLSDVAGVSAVEENRTDYHPQQG